MLDAYLTQASQAIKQVDNEISKPKRTLAAKETTGDHQEIYESYLGLKSPIRLILAEIWHYPQICCESVGCTFTSIDDRRYDRLRAVCAL